MAQDDLRQILVKHVIFSLLEPAELDTLLDRMQMQSFAMGQTIVEEGADGDCAYLIYSGRARVFHHAPGGKPVTLGTLKRGDLFGEQAIIRDDKRNASVRAAEDVVLFRIDSADFRQLLGRNPESKKYFDKFIRDTSIINFLRMTTVMGALPAKQIISLLQQLEEETVAAGDALFSEGDPGDRMYIIRSGEVRVTKTRNDRESLLTCLTDGDYFGELALVEDSPRAATVTATVETRCFSLARENFAKLIETAPKLERQLRTRIKEYSIDADAEKRYAPPQTGSEEPAPPEPSPVKETPTVDTKTTAFRWLARFPFVRQHDEMDCGAAALAMVCRFYGVHLTMGRLRELVNVGRGGASMYSLASAADSLGFETQAKRVDWDTLSNADLPAIVHWKNYHYVVVYRVRRDEVVVGDPAIGVLRMSREEFNNGWTGVALFLGATDKLSDVSSDTSLLSRVCNVLQPFRWQLLEIGVVTLMLHLFSLTIPVFVQVIVDRVMLLENARLLDTLFVGVLVAGFFHIATIVLRQDLLERLSARLGRRVSSSFFQRVLSLEMRFFRSHTPDEILSRFQDIRNLRNILSSRILRPGSDALALLLYGAVMCLYSPLLAGITLLFAPAYLLYAIGVTTILQRNHRRLYEHDAMMQARANEAVRGIETIKTTGAELLARWRYDHLLNRWGQLRSEHSRWELWSTAISRSLQIFAVIVVVWCGTHQVLSGHLTLGQLMAFQILLGMLMVPLTSMAELWQRVPATRHAMERLVDVFDAPAEEDSTARVHLPSINGHVIFDDVSYRYGGDGKKAVANVSFEVHPGQLVGVLGRPGSGKSTMASMLFGFQQPSSGRILLDDIDLSTLHHPSLRQQLGVVLQHNHIFAGSVRENISLADPDAPLERVVAAAKLACAHDFITNLPDGYETPVGDGGVALSRGFAQRLAIARALLHEPRLLILDDVTADLDYETMSSIFDNLLPLLADRTTILFTQRPSVMQHVDHIVVMDDGVVVEEGNHRELMERHGLYRYLYSHEVQR